MSDYTLVISENLHDKARRIAEQTARPVDELIRARLEESFNSIPLDLADDERAELNALTHLSNDTLWTIAREQMPSVQQDVMQELMDKNNFGTIIPTEFDQLM